MNSCWIFDEIHTFRRWRNFLEGLWDGGGAGQRILVTGSARLDLYRYSGDSLQGRHHLLRLHPLSVAELGLSSAADLRQLLELGGFPEPFFSGSATEARRWSREYRSTASLCLEHRACDTRLDRGVRYRKSRFPGCAAWQVSATGTKDYQTPEGIRVAPALEPLRTLV